uniref:Uncharacterized protein n=1 Tax=Panagrolaimus sp. JU765 TaxID=591449 RepID=A0AC34QI12_9BILA
MLNPRSDCVRFNGLGKSDTVRRLIFHADHFQAQFNSDRQAVVKYSHMVEFLTCATASKELVIEQTYKDTHDQMNCFTGLYQILKGFGRNVEYLELTGQFNQKQVTDWLDPLVSLHELVFLDFRFDVIGNLSMIFRYISPSVKVLYFDARLTNKPDFLDTMHAFYDMNIKLKRDTLFKKLFFCVHNFPTRSRFTEALDIINTRMDPNGTVTVLTNQMVDDEICCLLEQHGLYLKWTGYFRESLNHSTKIKYALFAGRWQQIKWEIALACPKASR